MTAQVLRRGACPGLLAPMATGDGLLVRLPAGLGPLALADFRAIAEAGARYGNGMIEVTARGSIQARGFDPPGAGAFADVLAGLGIGDRPGPAVLGNPLAGIDPSEISDTRELVSEVRTAAAAFAGRLGPKVSVVLDGGGALTLDEVAADIRFRAETNPSETVFRVGVAGDDRSAIWLGVIAGREVALATSALLAIIAAGGSDRRARDIPAAAFRHAVADLVGEAGAPPPPKPGEPIGIHALRDGSVAVGLGLPFGQTDAETLGSLLDFAAVSGARSIAAAPRRALLIVGVQAVAVDVLAEDAARLGFVVRANDPGRSLIACTGAPRCGSALAPARGIAKEVVAAAGLLLDGSVTIHLSGCAKGCAHPGAAPLTLVGEAGGYGVVLDGTARSTPELRVPESALSAWLHRLSSDVGRARRPGESTADVLRRVVTPILEDAGP